MNTEARTQALLAALVEQHRASRCAKLREQAQRDARATIAEALRAGRARVHDAIVEERHRREGALAAA
jgi:hypothetical protein